MKGSVLTSDRGKRAFRYQHGTLRVTCCTFGAVDWFRPRVAVPTLTRGLDLVEFQIGKHSIEKYLSNIYLGEG